MNFLKLYLLEGKQRVEIPIDKLQIREDMATGDVILGIRPEDLCIVEDDGDLIG